MTKMVVLANSFKTGNRCLAGIDLNTRTWVRPVSESANGDITLAYMRQHYGNNPQILDIVEIPLEDSGPDYGFEKENRSIIPGKQWARQGTMTPAELEGYVDQFEHALHNADSTVPLEVMHAMDPVERRTLQLVTVADFATTDEPHPSSNRPHRWMGSFTAGGNRIKVSITDPVYCHALDGGHSSARRALLTLSLGMPYPEDAPADQQRCYKLIAGVVEL